MDKFDLEELVMGIIVNAGMARSLSFEALQLAKKGEFDKAQEQLDQARNAANEAHAVQTQLIEHDQGEGKVQMTLVLVHAQDHLMTSMLCRELVEEMIQLYKRLG
ncbi:PTS lactose/cellobiose transporter subunit IIA [Photobacterium rosenbergii]|uniref:PTS lactose/cellobiose transporter subunit IIA n=1 Tax=Photobacterium rosenbergii TaxID=294936 RepID=UPI001C99BE0A|nr:PTS lactose/cellobiose transporter subunit IIA [Photobacterium rosenbergii]MBY5944704.1 PTS lactose/cellobiose transporter subunit IIA [Photobacterium rosenbergii]